VHHTGDGLFRGLPEPAPFTRYHSLHLRDLPAQVRCTAWTADGLVMAIAHTDLPACGVQFHPESMLSPAGRDLLANFLQPKPGSAE
jgi:anthranilate/para-aminobenzoate synthase component II